MSNKNEYVHFRFFTVSKRGPKSYADCPAAPDPIGAHRQLSRFGASRTGQSVSSGIKTTLWQRLWPGRAALIPSPIAATGTDFSGT